MKHRRDAWTASTALVVAVAALIGARTDAQSAKIAGATCISPPPFHCPDADCPPALVAHRGNAFLAKSNRAFFLDYPCDLKPGEAVTFILNLHGGAMIGNWHRHYFPLLDLKDKYRLVVATPSAINSLWNPENDDTHLRNVVDFVYRQFGERNIKGFWIAGHSHGGVTANRLLRTSFYRARLTGWVSLSGGRLGSPRAYWPQDSPSSYMLPTPSASPSAPAAAEPHSIIEPGVGLTDASILPDYGFSHIYTSGEYELTAAGLPDHSLWAQRLGCQAQTRRPDVVDTKAGYVWDSRSPTTRNTIAGRKPRPGRARIYVYEGCTGGHIVADVIRLDKGHTEGLEPNATEAIVKLMVSAKSEASPNR